MNRYSLKAAKTKRHIKRSPGKSRCVSKCPLAAESFTALNSLSSDVWIVAHWGLGSGLLLGIHLVCIQCPCDLATQFPHSSFPSRSHVDTRRCKTPGTQKLTFTRNHTVPRICLVWSIFSGIQRLLSDMKRTPSLYSQEVVKAHSWRPSEKHKFWATQVCWINLYCIPPKILLIFSNLWQCASEDQVSNNGVLLSTCSDLN